MTPKKFKSILKSIRNDPKVKDKFITNFYLKSAKEYNSEVLNYINRKYSINLHKNQLLFLLTKGVNSIICPFCRKNVVTCTSKNSTRNTCGSLSCISSHKNITRNKVKELSNISELGLKGKKLKRKLDTFLLYLNPKNKKVRIPNIDNKENNISEILIGTGKLVYIGKKKYKIDDLYKKLENFGEQLSISLLKRLLLYGSNSLICPYCKKICANYKKSCGSVECGLLKKQDTNKDKFGYNYASQSPKIKSIIKENRVKRIEEDENYINNINKKREQSCINIYGVTNYTKTSEYKEKVKNKSKINYGVEHHLKSEIVKAKRIKTLQEEYGVVNVSQIPAVKTKIKKTYSLRTQEQERERIEKAYTTRKENGTHSTSKPELQAANMLQAIFPKAKHNYRTKKYPYPCDFYIPELKLYIEYQGTWYHSNEPYDKDNKEHKQRLKTWKKKAKNNPRIKEGKKGNGWKSAIKTWTKSDPEKRKIAKKNNLNWVEFFKKEDLFDYILKLRNNKILSEIKEFLDKKKIPYIKKKRFFQLTDNIRLEFVNPEKTTVNYYEKRLRLENKGKFSYLIRSYEWLDQRKRKIIKSNILHLVGKTKHRIFARKTKVIELSNKEVKQFQLDNCFYGYRPASLNLGLEYEGKLVMVTTFGNNFFGRKKDIEIYRVGTLRNHHVVGGTTKLIKYYQNYYNPENKRIKYYLDCCHHNGKSLTEDNSFIFVKSTRGFHNYNLEDMIASNRNPSKHKEIKQLVKEGVFKEISTSGTNTYFIN